MGESGGSAVWHGERRREGSGESQFSHHHSKREARRGAGAARLLQLLPCMPAWGSMGGAGVGVRRSDGSLTIKF